MLGKDYTAERVGETCTSGTMPLTKRLSIYIIRMYLSNEGGGGTFAG